MLCRLSTFTATLLFAGVLTALSAHAGTAFYTHESTSGMKKICYYDYLGDTIAITIVAVALCPLTIQV